MDLPKKISKLRAKLAPQMFDGLLREAALEARTGAMLNAFLPMISALAPKPMPAAPPPVTDHSQDGDEQAWRWNESVFPALDGEWKADPTLPRTNATRVRLCGVPVRPSGPDAEFLFTESDLLPCTNPRGHDGDHAFDAAEEDKLFDAFTDWINAGGDGVKEFLNETVPDVVAAMQRRDELLAEVHGGASESPVILLEKAIAAARAPADLDHEALADKALDLAHMLAVKILTYEERKLAENRGPGPAVSETPDPPNPLAALA